MYNIVDDPSDVEFFREAFSRYHREIRMSKLISEQKSIGMILVDSTKMKQLILPSPQRCLDVINEILPIIARKEVDALIKESQDAEYTLCNESTNTVDYVNALNFLSEIQVRVGHCDLWFSFRNRVFSSRWNPWNRKQKSSRKCMT